MPIMSEKYSSYPAPVRELKKMLGLPLKLPNVWKVWQIQGYRVVLMTQDAVQRKNPTAYKPHRIFVHCRFCNKRIPYGRLVQHENPCADEHRTAKLIDSADAPKVE